MENTFRNLWNEVLKSKNKTQLFLRYFGIFLWPKQYIGAMQWFRQKFGKKITEAYLPLKKGSMNWARGMYGAFVCVMSPENFIRLTTSDQKEYDKIFSDKYANLNSYKSDGNTDDDYDNKNYNKNMYNMPFLYVNYETGKVTAHEGRHRAAMIDKEGGNTFPCLVIFEYSNEYQVTFKVEPLLYNDDGRFIDYDYDNAYDDEKIFKSKEDAEEFEKYLRSENESIQPKIFYSRIEINVIFGGKMKGSPRSDPSNWKFDAWKKEDMPAQFIGQYNNSVKVPTSSMRFGPVKGHTHFKS